MQYSLFLNNHGVCMTFTPPLNSSQQASRSSSPDPENNGYELIKEAIDVILSTENRGRQPLSPDRVSRSSSREREDKTDQAHSTHKPKLINQLLEMSEHEHHRNGIAIIHTPLDLRGRLK